MWIVKDLRETDVNRGKIAALGHQLQPHGSPFSLAFRPRIYPALSSLEGLPKTQNSNEKHCSQSFSVNRKWYIYGGSTGPLGAGLLTSGSAVTRLYSYN